MFTEKSMLSFKNEKGDEAEEAQELERVIEGDEFEERPRSRSRSPDNSDENSAKEDEAEEDKRRVDPTKQKAKRVIKNPRFVLNPARLIGPRGIQVIPEHFKDFKFKGKGHEKEDLDLVLKKLEHWAYRLYPKYQFEDCLRKMETLGKKQPVKVHLHRIRTDQLLSQETVVQKDSSDDEQTAAPPEEDEFDKLLQQQIELARATPAPGSVKKGFMTPAEKTFAPPRATSSPSINDEQRERMLRNRQMAEERRLARLKQNSSANVTIDLSENQQNQNAIAVSVNEVIDITEQAATQTTTKIDETTMVDLTSINYTDTVSKNITNNEIEMTTEKPVIVLDTEVVNPRKINRSNVIDSSDEECDVIAVNQSVCVDIHNNFNANQNEKAVDKGDDETKRNSDTDIIEYTTNIGIEAVTSNESVNAERIQEIVPDKSVSIANTIADNITEADDFNSSNKEKNDNEVTNNSNIQDDTKNFDIVNKVPSDLNTDTNDKNKVILENKIVATVNEKAKNKNTEIDKENVDTNIIQEEGIDEVMDVDFSEEF